MPAYKDKNGKWYCKFSVKGKQILKRGFDTKRDALKYETQIKSSNSTGQNITFRSVQESYYKYREVAESTRIRQVPMFDKYVTFADLPYSRITKKVLLDWYLEIQDNKLAPATKNLVLRVVKQIFKFGAEFYELPNYSVGLKPFKVTKKEMNVWTVEEFDKFIDHVKLPVYRYYFIVLYWTGMRETECATLRYTDIENNLVHVHGTKTYHSDRTIIVTDAIARIFSLLSANCDEKRPFIFGMYEPLKNPSIHRVFKCAIKNAGVKEIRVHDLRHSFATNAIQNGCDIVAVSKYLGHSDITTTLKVYTHLLEKTQTDMINKLNSLISVSNSYQT